MAFKTTIKVALLTGAAKDDTFTTEATGLSEDMLTAFLNVLANDPGSAQLYALHSSEPTGTGQMDNPLLEITSELGATIKIQLDDGTIFYDATNIKSRLDELAEGEFETDTFYYTVRMANGALSTALVTLEIAGVNDRPEIQDGGVTTADIYELASSDPDANSNENQEVKGSFFVKDVDLTDTLTVEVTNGPTDSRGVLTATVSDTLANGNREVNWTYTYTDAALDSLISIGESTSESFEIQISDATETVSQTITLDLYGANDQTIGEGEEYGEVIEQANGPFYQNNLIHEINGGEMQTSFTSMSWIEDLDNSPNLGNFSAELSSTGMATWDFSIEDKYLDYLREGEIVTQKFLVTFSNESSIFINTIIVELKGSQDNNAIEDPEGEGPGLFETSIPNQIVRGLGGDDNFIFLHLAYQRVYGDDGNDNFHMYDLDYSLVRGGNGNDTFTIDYLATQNEIYGDNGDDLFEIKYAEKNQLWGGPDTDTFKVLVDTGDVYSVSNDFDTGSPETGGDKIDLTGITGLDWNTLELLQSSTEDNQYLLTADVLATYQGLVNRTFLTIVGTNLELSDLTDGNLVGYTV